MKNELTSPLPRIVRTCKSRGSAISAGGWNNDDQIRWQKLSSNLPDRVTSGSELRRWPKLKTTSFTRLSAGDRVGSLEVIASPGHTPGHVSYLDTREGSLIAGDVFTAIGGLAVSSHFHWRFPFVTMATWDRAVDLKSARALGRVKPAVLTVGHGGPVRHPIAAMDEAIARAERAAG